MQAKINAFFKPNTKNPDFASTSPIKEVEKEEPLGRNNVPDVLVTYTRRHVNQPPVSACDDSRIDKKHDTSIKKSNPEPRVIHKKRSYAQYHLELGQSDFLFHSCKVCGLSYSCGDEEDEEIHKAFHKNYYQGIQFKGWRNERVIPMPGSENNEERIILVLDSDPPAKKHKVREVIKLMANDLCSTDEWLLHKLCKTYLFISRKRIVGCLLMEPIKKAHRIVSNSDSKGSPLNSKTNSFARPASTVLQFGNITFQREPMKKCSSSTITTAARRKAIDAGAVLCEEEAVSANCGVRAIWVVPSCQNQRVATRLLDAARESFMANSDLTPSECAFSAPTSDGRSFAASYSGTESFLVYKDDD